MKFLPHFPKLSFGIIIICFLLPFVTVKCNDTVIAKLNGIDLITGTQIQADTEDDKVIDPNIFVISSLVLAAAGLVLAFLKFRGNKIISLVVSVLGLAALIAFYFDCHNENDASVGTIIIIITMGIGYYIATLGFLINSIFFGYSLNQKDAAENTSIRPEPE